MEIKVHVRPNSSQNELISRGDIWKVNIAASPEKGEANRELVKFLQKELGKSVKILRGLKSHNKTILIY